MRFNSSSAFAYAASGRFSESMIKEYDDRISRRLEKYSSRAGWLGEAVSRANEAHRYFIDSGMWDYANYIKSNSGIYVGRFEIGYLGSVEAQRNAEGLMQHVIQANPTIRELIREERINGYYEINDEEAWGREMDYYYNKLTSGVALTRDEEIVIRNYLTSRDSHTTYTMRERADAMKTWRMSDRIVKSNIDPISMGYVLTTEEVEERRKNEEGKNDE